MGISHLMFHPYPYNTTSVDRLAEAMRIYRELSANE